MVRCIPNIISLSRGVAAIAILFTPAFSVSFWALYVWCGLSDMIDGPLARKLNATSRKGEVIDSVCDFIFVVTAMVRIIPAADIPNWLWWWAGLIASWKVLNTMAASMHRHRIVTFHTLANKITGLLLFLLPFTIHSPIFKLSVIVVCSIATIAAFEETARS